MPTLIGRDELTFETSDPNVHASGFHNKDIKPWQYIEMGLIYIAVSRLNRWLMQEANKMTAWVPFTSKWSKPVRLVAVQSCHFLFWIVVQLLLQCFPTSKGCFLHKLKQKVKRVIWNLGFHFICNQIWDFFYTRAMTGSNAASSKPLGEDRVKTLLTL